MWLKASFNPELREKSIEQTEKERNGSTQSNQRIHVAALLFQLFPCADVEAASKIEHGQRKQ